jgi:hypothetical protein
MDAVGYSSAIDSQGCLIALAAHQIGGFLRVLTDAGGLVLDTVRPDQGWQYPGLIALNVNAGLLATSAYTGDDGLICVMSVKTGVLVNQIRVAGYVTFLAVLDDGSILAARGGTIQRASANENSATTLLDLGTGVSILQVDVGRDGALAFVGYRYTRAMPAYYQFEWGLMTAAGELRLHQPMLAKIMGRAFVSLDGDLAMGEVVEPGSGLRGEMICLRRVKSGDEIVGPFASRSFSVWTLSRSGRVLAAAEKEGPIHLWTARA